MRIHLDTSFLIRALVPGTPEDDLLRSWFEAEHPIEMSTIAWAEFCCGPLDERAYANACILVPTRKPFGEQEATLAAHLFNESGRRRGSMADCMIAASALCASAQLATSNPADFERIATGRLVLASR
jgi:predicted nucleic acid-binding protein